MPILRLDYNPSTKKYTLSSFFKFGPFTISRGPKLENPFMIPLIHTYFTDQAKIRSMVREGYTLEFPNPNNFVPGQIQKTIPEHFKERYERFIADNAEKWRHEMTEFKKHREDDFYDTRRYIIESGMFGVLLFGALAVVAGLGLLFPPAGAVVGAVLLGVTAVACGVGTVLAYRKARSNYAKETIELEARDKEAQAIINPSSGEPEPAPTATASPLISIPTQSPSVESTTSSDATVHTPNEENSSPKGKRVT